MFGRVARPDFVFWNGFRQHRTRTENAVFPHRATRNHRGSSADNSTFLKGDGLPFFPVVGGRKLVVEQHCRRSDEHVVVQNARISNVCCSLDFTPVTDHDPLSDVREGADGNSLANEGIMADVTGPPRHGTLAEFNPLAGQWQLCHGVTSWLDAQFTHQHRNMAFGFDVVTGPSECTVGLNHKG